MFGLLIPAVWCLNFLLNKAVHAGVMNYGTGYWGVLEANYLVVAGHWVTMLLGHEVNMCSAHCCLTCQCSNWLHREKVELHQANVAGVGWQVQQHSGLAAARGPDSQTRRPQPPVGVGSWHTTDPWADLAYNGSQGEKYKGHSSVDTGQDTELVKSMQATCHTCCGKLNPANCWLLFGHTSVYAATLYFKAYLIEEA